MNGNAWQKECLHTSDDFSKMSPSQELDPVNAH